ncbi:MAG: PAS domain S-box protein, partial [Armatimonadetes bacterium]|nr:PAS domain S-box protein [Armatimonadota bacterium]
MVEDSEDDALLMLRELRGVGPAIEHVRVETREELNRALEERSWDLILLDYNLPQFSAPEALQILHARAIDVPIIVVSGTIGEDAAVECMKAGAYDYVMKDNLKRLRPAAARELVEAEARREARLQAQRVATLVDAAQVLIVGRDAEGRITLFNRMCENLTGHSAAEVLGRHVKELPPGFEWLASALNAFDDEQLEYGFTDLGHVLIDTHGREHIITWRPAPLHGADGNLHELLVIGLDITAQIEAEQHYRTLVDTMGDGLTVVDKAGRLTYANEAFCSMLEYTTSEVVGRRLVDLCSGEDRALLQAQLTERFDSGPAADYELNYIAKSGRQVPVLVKATALRDATGEITGAFAVIKDMTEYKRAREILRERAQIISQTNDVITVTDPEGTITYVNKACERLLGVDSEHLVGRHVEVLGENPARGATQQEILTATLKNGSWHGEVINRTSDGREVVLDCHTFVLRNDDGEVTALVGISRDITERKQMEEALRASEERAQTYLQMAGTILVVLSTDGRVELINRKGCEVLGYPAEEITGKDWFANFLPERERASMRELFDKLITRGTETGEYHENSILTSSGEERLIAWRNSVLTDARGKPIGVLASGDDVTDRRRMEEALRESEASLSAIVT